MSVQLGFEVATTGIRVSYNGDSRFFTIGVLYWYNTGSISLSAHYWDPTARLQHRNYNIIKKKTPNYQYGTTIQGRICENGSPSGQSGGCERGGERIVCRSVAAKNGERRAPMVRLGGGFVVPAIKCVSYVDVIMGI